MWIGGISLVFCLGLLMRSWAFWYLGYVERFLFSTLSNIYIYMNIELSKNSESTMLEDASGCSYFFFADCCFFIVLSFVCILNLML